MFKGIKNFFKSAGPGIVTGAADDDPSGIATYSQTGAQFGYGRLWATFAILPLVVSVQEACGRIGAVTGKGIAAVIKENYNKKVLYGTVMLVVIANTINIGADLGAMGAAAQLIIPLPFEILVLFFTALTLILEIFVSYRVYSKILKWFALCPITYPLTVFLIDQPWTIIFKSTFIPKIEWNFEYLFIITGVLGTTISPYVFFWQASEEVEEEKDLGIIQSNNRPKINWGFIKAMRMDTVFGLFSSVLAAWCIIIVSGTVLNQSGITDIQTAADAARALEPLVQSFPHAGYIAKVIFAVGIVGLGLLGVPVLAASASYAVSETLSMKEGLNLKLKEAHGFYGVITIATLIGLMINFVGIDPMKALVFTAVFNGVAAVPLIFIIARIAQNKNIMGEYSSGKLSKIFIWFTFMIMAAAAIMMFISFAR